MQGDFFMGFADLIFPDEDNSGMGITPDRYLVQVVGIGGLGKMILDKFNL
ncbi:hypothetical protein Hanom_Chr14g01252291 [Helianthus anomalus]